LRKGGWLGEELLRKKCFVAGWVQNLVSDPKVGCAESSWDIPYLLTPLKENTKAAINAAIILNAATLPVRFTHASAMVREDKQLPSPPPEDSKSPYGKSKHVKGSSSSSSLVKRLASSSSLTSNGQVKRTTYGSSTNGLKKVDPNDDLLILLLAQKAATDSQDCNILNPEEVEELKNVKPSFHPLHSH
jgi:hypothetical protein